MKINMMKKGFLLLCIITQSLFAGNLLITPPSPLSTNESGSSSFSMVLSAMPTEDVYVWCESSNLYEGYCPGAKIFTAANWNTPQLFPVLGVNDYNIDGTQNYTVTFKYSNLSDIDSDFSGVESYDLESIDSNTQPVVVSPEAGLITTESGGSDTFTVVLQQQPTDDVTIAITSSDTSLGVVDKASLTFTAINWNTPQTVTVTGVDDDGTNQGTTNYSVVLSPAVSTDPFYNNYDPVDITVGNYDNNSATVNIVPLTTTQTSETGTSIELAISLNKLIVADETIQILGDTSESALSTSSMTFTSANWNIPQTLTVTGVEDNIKDGDITYSLRFSSISFSSSSIDITNIDSTNGPSPVIITPIDTNLSEDGDTARFSVVLGAAPSQTVFFPFAITQETQTTFSTPSPLVFTTLNWDVAQEVIISAVDDALYESTQEYLVQFPGMSSPVIDYTDRTWEPISIINYDNDEAYSLVVNTSGTETSESGTTTSFEVSLDKAPSSDIRVAISSSDVSEGMIVSPTTGYLYFTVDNWNIPQNVIVKGVDDMVVDSTVSYKINIVSEFIQQFEGVSLSISKSIAMRNLDNDVIPSSGFDESLFLLDDTQGKNFDIASSTLSDGTIVNTATSGEIVLEVQRTPTGNTKIGLGTKDTNGTKVTSELPNMRVSLFEDGNGTVGIRAVATTTHDNKEVEIELVVHSDGTSAYSVNIDGLRTKTSIELVGAEIYVSEDGTVKTTYSEKPEECRGNYNKVELITLITGETISKFITLDCEDNIVNVRETFLEHKKLPHGSQIVLRKNKLGKIVIELVFQLDEEFSFGEKE